MPLDLTHIFALDYICTHDENNVSAQNLILDNGNTFAFPFFLQVALILFVLVPVTHTQLGLSWPR